MHTGAVTTETGGDCRTVTNTFCHAGDLGDIVSSLPTVRQLGGGTYVLRPHPFRTGGPREPMTRRRADFLLPLLRAQSYIHDARFEEHYPTPTHDFADLRITTSKDDSRESLADWHAKHCQLEPEKLDVSPWLRADPFPHHAGKVVVACSTRYPNKEFPWMKVFHRHKGNVIFLGTLEEQHKLLTAASGRLPRAQCQNALEMAQVVAGAKMVYCNQTFVAWLALGLGVPVCIACWAASPDVRIARANARYIFDKKHNPSFYKDLE